MSFRELRNFSIYLQTLGYPRHVSIESFRTPNFSLVSNILSWLLNRLEPSTTIISNLNTPEDRVEFLHQAWQITWQCTGININLRKLYNADGYAVKEMLKIASLLYKAVQLTKEEITTPDFLVGSEMDSFRDCRGLGSQLVQIGSKVHENMGLEIQNRAAREIAVKFLDELAYNLESNEPQQKIERSIVTQINNASEDIDRLQKQIQNFEKDEKNLSKKLLRKTAELERVKKQLQNLKQMELPFMAEQNQLEEELRHIYESYIETYRSLSWLDNEVLVYRETELLKKTEADRQLKRMQKRLREEQRRQDRGATDDLDNLLFQDDISESSSEESEEQPNNSTKTYTTSEFNNQNKMSKRPRRPSSRRGVFTNFEEESSSPTPKDSGTPRGSSAKDSDGSLSDMDPLQDDDLSNTDSEFDTDDSHF